MFREVKWTERSEQHVARHTVTPEEVEEVASSADSTETLSRDGTTAVFGTTLAGRYLIVLLAEAEDGRDYVVTARNMSDREKRAFREKGRYL